MLTLPLLTLSTITPGNELHTHSPAARPELIMFSIVHAADMAVGIGRPGSPLVVEARHGLVRTGICLLPVLCSTWCALEHTEDHVFSPHERAPAALR